MIQYSLFSCTQQLSSVCILYLCIYNVRNEIRIVRFEMRLCRRQSNIINVTCVVCTLYNQWILLFIMYIDDATEYFTYHKCLSENKLDKICWKISSVEIIWRAHRSVSWRDQIHACTPESGLLIRRCAISKIIGIGIVKRIYL